MAAVVRPAFIKKLFFFGRKWPQIGGAPYRRMRLIVGSICTLAKHLLTVNISIL